MEQEMDRIPMSYGKSPYIYQRDLASSLYSGPSTSLRPSFETTGEFGPPSHCDTNEYYSRSQSRSSNRSDVSLPHVNVADTPSVRPANLDRLIKDHMKTEEGRRDLQAWLDEDQEAPSSDIPETPSRKQPLKYLQPFITKTADSIKNGYKRSKEAVNSLRSPSHIKSPVTYVVDGDENAVNETHKRHGVYFLARIDKKLYDITKSAKKAAGRSGNLILGRENKTKSERWQTKLNKSYHDVSHGQASGI